MRGYDRGNGADRAAFSASPGVGFSAPGAVGGDQGGGVVGHEPGHADPQQQPMHRGHGPAPLPGTFLPIRHARPPIKIVQ
ncbi:hypothetical protein ACFQHO_39680 [Actinomadura yumaensis]|uniref:hypothetical protein n=1 Tax=Actinomadura yumaensis TaxID=111807 RepID=UPI003613B4DC